MEGPRSTQHRGETIVLVTEPGGAASYRGCQAKRAPRAAFPSGCLAAQIKRWAEGIRVPGPLAGKFCRFHIQLDK